MAQPVVLVVGVTGMLGSKIADALIEGGRARVRALVRNPEKKAAELAPLQARGVEIRGGDVLDPAAVAEAVAGADTVVSALNNDPSLTIDAQTLILRAAERAGVRRFVPSDFSVDFRALDYGDNVNLDMRKQFHEMLLAGSPVEYTSVLQGAFTEMLLTPGFSPWDGATQTLSYWGDPTQKLDYTTVEDTARYVAETIFDPGTANRALLVAGDQISTVELGRVYEEITGKPVTLRNLGSADDLWRRIQELKPLAKNPWEYIALQYAWTMVTGKAKLHGVMNDRYPNIKPASVREFLAIAAKNRG